jgi:hypothetical protein
MNNITNMENEIWKDIPEWEGYYQVSNVGRIRSLDRRTSFGSVKGKTLNQHLNKQHRLYVCFSRNHKPKKYLVFQLVARAFIKDVKDFRCFKHKNGDLTDNRSENIIYDNRDEKINDGIKICDYCRKEFSLDNFYIQKTGRVSKDCKECEKKNKKEYYSQNADMMIERAKIYYSKNKKAARARNRIYFQKNKKEIYRKERETKKLREKTDIAYRLRRRYKNLLYNGFRRQGLWKNWRSSREFVGCSFEEFKQYLESQFEPWMTWDNYGKDGWHFGHKICCELFDFTNEKQVKICFHYTNLRPEDGLQNITNQDFLPDGRRARDLSKEEKIVYLESMGIKL